MTGGSRNLRRSALGSGGLLASAAGFRLNGTVGEPAAAPLSAAGFRLGSGLHSILAQPGSVASIVAVSKATGSLELAWTAPGRDGIIGAVAGGAWRIDYSSDTGHAFSPSVYRVVLSTTFSAGAPQAYTLTGLEANTTYFARIYLSDDRGALSEDSSPSAESTLARTPISPMLSGVFMSSVTFTWTLPAGGAEGYRLDGSSTDFGALPPDDILRSSRTSDGTALTLSVLGLRSNTTYYFRLGSLNWQSDVNFVTVIATVTLPGAPEPIMNLSSDPDAWGRNLRFAWSNPVFADPAGVLVLASTQTISADVENGVAYPAGYVFADGSVVRSSAAAADHLESGLELDTTYFYRFYSRNLSDLYSVHVATALFLDLPPMGPAGLFASADAGRTQIAIGWSSVTTSMDGTPFQDPASPRNLELRRYDVFRATGIAHPSWVWVGSATTAGSSWSGPIPDPDSVYYYRVASQDDVGGEDTRMAVDTRGNVYALAPDRVSHLMVPAELAAVLRPEGNSFGSPIFLRGSESPAEVGGRVVRSIRFDPLQPSGAIAGSIRTADAGMEVLLHYDVQGGQVVPSAYAPQGARLALAPGPQSGPPNAEDRLSAYWHNGEKYVKVFGRVDTGAQTVRLNTSLPGAYQVRSLVRTEGFSFDVSQVTNKVITPNHDGINDYVTFIFDNPRDAAPSGRIYDLRGALVSEMRRGTQVADSLVWDGTAGGRVVPRGVYIYQIQAEGKTFNGTVVVIR